MAIYQINGVDMPSPSGFEITYKTNGKAELVASGNTVMDRLSIKRRIVITYNHIFYNPLKEILENILQGDVFFDLSFVDPGKMAWETISVRMESIKLPSTRYSLIMPQQYGNVQLVLEER